MKIVIICFTNNDKLKLKQHSNYTKYFARQEYLFKIFKHVSENQQNIQYYFYYFKSQRTPLLKKLLRIGRYGFFILNKNTFLIELNENTYQNFSSSPQKLKDIYDITLSNCDILLDLPQFFSHMLPKKDIFQLKVDAFLFSRFPYPDSIFILSKYLSISNDSVFFDYVEKDFNFDKNKSHYVINEIRNFHRSIIKKDFPQSRVLNYINKKRRGRKLILIPLSLYYGNLNNQKDRWLLVIKSFEKELYSKIPKDIDIILTCHQYVYQNTEGEKARRYLQVIADKYPNIIYNQNLFYSSTNISQWLVFFVDAVVVSGSNYSSIIFQALFYKVRVFCEEAPNDIFYKVSD